MPSTLRPLGLAFTAGDPAAVLATFAPDLTLHVAVHDEPFVGRDVAGQILGVVLDGVLTDIEVVETVEATGEGPAFLLFRASVEGYPRRADGLLVVRFDAVGAIRDLTVHLRPLAGLAALADAMGARLGGPRPDGGT